MKLSQISLSALRTFAVVARSESLSIAAEQLCISPSAVSHQMKLLERQIGHVLFIRRSKGVKLTTVGERLSNHVISAIQSLEQGISQLEHHSLQTLTVATIPAISQLWLSPKLQFFYEQAPDINLSIFDQDGLVDFTHQPADLHLHFGSGEFLGCKSVLLMDEHVVPVCSPTLLARYENPEALLQASDVRRLTYAGYAEDAIGGITWQGWFNHSKLILNQHQAETRYNHLAPLFQSAKHGQGIALGWERLIEADIKSGNLVALSDIRMPLKYSYYFVIPEHNTEKREVQAFIDWAKSFSSTHNDT